MKKSELKALLRRKNRALDWFDAECTRLQDRLDDSNNQLADVSKTLYNCRIAKFDIKRAYDELLSRNERLQYRFNRLAYISMGWCVLAVGSVLYIVLN